MQRVIEKFLRIRRTAYPAQVKNIRCSEPRNLTKLAVEYCRHPYCQTLILTDHDTGKLLFISFVKYSIIIFFLLFFFSCKLNISIFLFETSKN